MTDQPLSQQLHKRYANDPDYQAANSEIAPFEALTLQVVHYRCQAGLSQGQLAQKLGTSRSSIARIESLEYGKMSLTTLKRIADALDLDLNIQLTPRLAA